MNIRLLLLVAALGTLGSCATYKNGQTPDDVYYSPGRTVEQYVVSDQRNAERYDADRFEDMRLRQSIRDPRFRNMDDFNDDWRWRSNAFNAWNPMWGQTWNNPWMWNTWGLNTMGFGMNNWGWNNFGMNNWGWNNWGMNNWGWNNGPIMMFPGGGTHIIGTPSNLPRNNYGIRFSPGLQSFGNGSNMNAAPKTGSSRGNSRYFNSSTNGERRSNSTFRSFFGGSSNTNYSNYSNSSESGSRSINNAGGGFFNGGSSSGGSRSFNSGSTGSSGSSGGTRRN